MVQSLNRLCPVISRINPWWFIQARLRPAPARLAHVSVSAIGADMSGHSVRAMRKADGGARTGSAWLDPHAVTTLRPHRDDA